MLRFDELSLATEWMSMSETQTLRDVIGSRTKEFQVSVYELLEPR